MNLMTLLVLTWALIMKWKYGNSDVWKFTLWPKCIWLKRSLRQYSTCRRSFSVKPGTILNDGTDVNSLLAGILYLLLSDMGQTPIQSIQRTTDNRLRNQGTIIIKEQNTIHTPRQLNSEKTGEKWTIIFINKDSKQV